MGACGSREGSDERRDEPIWKPQAEVQIPVQPRVEDVDRHRLMRILPYDRTKSQKINGPKKPGL
jgi:hypothetical protein